MLRAAIIGVSGFGNVHYNDLKGQYESGLMKPVAAAIINQDEEKEKCEYLRSAGCEIFSDYKEMLAKHKGNIDICFIPTGIHLHRPMTIDALNAGANVFVEKPVVATYQEIAPMQEAAVKNDRYIAVGYQTMYASEAVTMKKLILEGAIGKLQTVKAYGIWPRPFSYYARNNWAGRLKIRDNWVLDSPYNNALAHQLNMICFLAGKKFDSSADLATVQSELYRAYEIESADTAAIRMMTDDGIKLLFIVSHCSEVNEGPIIEAKGEKGKITWHYSGKTVFETASGTETIQNEPGDSLRKSMMKSLRERVTDKSVFICSPAIAGVQTLCINGAHDSCTIKSIDKKFIKTVKLEKDDSRLVLENVDDVIREAFEKEVLFSELPNPPAWSSGVGKICDVRNYKGFPQV